MQAVAEEWRTITDFPNYAVSDMGRVKRIADSLCGYKAGKLLSLTPGKNGYPMVQLWSNKRFTKIYVHQLTLEKFVGPRPEGFVCNHIDACRTNNKPGNLEWISQSGNVLHCSKMGRKISPHLRGEENPFSKLKAGEVWLIKKLLASKKITQKMIGKMFCTSQAHISLFSTGKEWSSVTYP